jgi:hypothetical protein
MSQKRNFLFRFVLPRCVTLSTRAKEKKRDAMRGLGTGSRAAAATMSV